MKRSLSGAAVLTSLLLLVLIGSCGTAVSGSRGGGAADSFDPPVFTSSNHLLDLLVIAEAKPIPLGSFHPTAWVFEMCPTAVAQGDTCPAGSQTVAPYGGIRLQLYPGDHLRMKLVNHLPPAPADAENAHGSDPMMNAMLAANPINIHTHGLIVEPRQADATDPTYGDYVYVLGYPSGKLPSMVMADETATDQPIQYDIYIPPGHPSGVFWFHPHVHGLGVNQISEGLSGIITIGSVTDYLTTPANASIPERYFILKDMQVLASGNVQDQEDSNFCAPTDLAGVQRNGYCQGHLTSGIPDVHRDGPRPQEGSTGVPDYTGGLWFHTVNGRVYPQLPSPGGSGELWRFLNTGPSRSYDLVLRDDQTGAPIPFQVVALDGVSVAPPRGTTGVEIKADTAGGLDPVPCQGFATAYSTQPVCATHLVMFPSARAEIWVTPQPDSFTLITNEVDTGPAGDQWPQVNLAHIAAGSSSASPSAMLSVRAVAGRLLSAEGLLGAPVRAGFAGIPGSLDLEDARSLANGAPTAPGAAPVDADERAALRTRLSALSKPVASIASPNCSALPAGHRRRIFFGIPSSDPTAFGLGYEEVDANDNPVPGTFEDIAPFDPAKINVCLPLGPGNTPVTEEWELVNVAGEAHNFHIHQTKFYVVPQNAPAGDAGELMDNIALPTGGDACDGTVGTWRSGACPVSTVVVRIPFSEVGDFVYHCHIGEHQDGGMMAHIRVIASE
jgi:FtsP/CotA-like multicopper oxidase with cupredoxin domain